MKFFKTLLFSLAILTSLTQPTNLIASNVSSEDDESIPSASKYVPDANGLMGFTDTGFAVSFNRFGVTSLQMSEENKALIAKSKYVPDENVFMGHTDTGFSIPFNRFGVTSLQMSEENKALIAKSKYVPDANGLIEINGELKTMIEHISYVRSFDRESPLRFTDIKRFVSVNGSNFVGTLLDMPEEDMALIANNNYTYVPFNSMRYPTGDESGDRFAYALKLVNGSNYKEIGAIITGCKDHDLGVRLDMTGITYY